MFHCSESMAGMGEAGDSCTQLGAQHLNKLCQTASPEKFNSATPSTLAGIPSNREASEMVVLYSFHHHYYSFFLPFESVSLVTQISPKTVPIFAFITVVLSARRNVSAIVFLDLKLCLSSAFFLLDHSFLLKISSSLASRDIHSLLSLGF